jgi:hypothetical protein
LRGDDKLDPRAPWRVWHAAGDVFRHLASARLLALKLRLEAAAISCC